MKKVEISCSSASTVIVIPWFKFKWNIRISSKENFYLAMVDTSSNKSNIIIIGAGISGLTSALRIQQKAPDLIVTILEASNHAGGQLQSTHLGEIGAKWITEDQCHIYRLLKYLKIPTRRRSIIGPHMNKYWEVYDGLWGKVAKYELQRFVRELDLKSDIFKTGSERCGTFSMHSHIRKRLFFSSSRKFMMNLVLIISGVDSHDISYVDFMSICYSCGGIKRLIDLSIEAPSTLLEFTSRDLLNSIQNHLEYTKIIYGRKVCAISQYRDFVEVRDSENNTHTADAIILAVPWNCIEPIHFWPPLPMELRCPPIPADSTKYVLTSFLANYPESYWRSHGFSGQFVGLEPLLVANEYRPTTICGYYVHEEGIEPLVRSIILHKMAETFGDGMLTPIEFQQRTFELSPINHLPLTTPWNRVIWSSSAAAGTCYRGHLGGAVQSGLRAAVNALLVVHPQIVMWQDISEIQCHDYLPRRDISWSTLWLSTWNLYSASTYTMFFCGILLVLYKSYRKH